MIRDRPLMVGAMGLTGLTPGRLGILLRRSAREWSSLAFACTHCGFQFVTQSLIILPQSLIILPQPFQFLLKPLPLIF